MFAEQFSRFPDDVFTFMRDSDAFELLAEAGLLNDLLKGGGEGGDASGGPAADNGKGTVVRVHGGFRFHWIIGVRVWGAGGGDNGLMAFCLPRCRFSEGMARDIVRKSLAQMGVDAGPCR